MTERERCEGAERGLLAGIRVVEVGSRLAAPLVGMLFSEQGAEVIRVVPAGATPEDPVLDAILARGKTEAVLALADEAGREHLRRLVAQADVVVDDHPAGGLAALGVDLEALRARNPGLITCSIPGFTADHPLAGVVEHEEIVGAGGYLYEKPLGKPLVHGFPVSSVIAGLFASTAITGALLARLRDGRGQHIDVARFRAAIFAQILLVLVKTGVPRGFLPLKMVGTPFMGSWLCKGDRYIYLHMTLPAHAARILDVLEELGYRDDVAALRSVLSAETLRDPSQVKSIAEAKRIRVIYERIFLTKTPDEWEELLGGELCCIKVRTVDEWLRDSMQAGMSDASRVEDPIFGELMGPGPAVTSPEHPPVLRARVVDPDAWSQALARWEVAPRPGPDALPAADPRPGRAPLYGVRVVDLSRIIAGPCAARTLAELGADVLSVQSPTSLDWALSFHLLFNAGKRSVTLDFRDDAGKEKLWKILEDFRPDALVQNYRHLDIARAAGVDPDAVRAHFPDIVYTHLNAYGNSGVWQERPGFEQVVQAVSGIQM